MLFVMGGFWTAPLHFKQAQVRFLRHAVATHHAPRRCLFWHLLVIKIDTASAHDALFMHVGDDRLLVIGGWSSLHAISPLHALNDLRSASLMEMLCNFVANR